MENAAPRAFAVRALASVGYRATRLSERLRTGGVDDSAPAGPTLAGDRDVEWAWCAAHIRAEPGRVLDFGAGHGLLSLVAAFRGHDVVAVDLEPQSFSFGDARIEYRRGDINALDFGDESFDQVINCSTIEHVGLAGRYGSAHDPDGDVRAMERLATLLEPTGTMVLTLPVGRDAVFPPWHRVYGHGRLPRLLAPYAVHTESYRAKPRDERWEEVTRDEALDVVGSAAYYALGLFVLGVA